MRAPMKQCVSLLLALTLLFSLGGAASARGAAAPAAAGGEGLILPQWANTVSITLSLSFDGGRAICGARVIGKTGTTEITGTVVLERRNTDGTYTTVKTWDDLEASGSILIFDGIHYVATGYTYRLSITATVYHNGTAETVSGSYEAYAG